jgi:hypothetical protein
MPMPVKAGFANRSATAEVLSRLRFKAPLPLFKGRDGFRQT